MKWTALVQYLDCTYEALFYSYCTSHLKRFTLNASHSPIHTHAFTPANPPVAERHLYHLCHHLPERLFNYID